MNKLKLFSHNISDLSEVQDPELIINFINEVFNDFRPIYSKGGHWTLSDVHTISQKYEQMKGLLTFDFYDGKIFHGVYKGVLISFIHMDMTYSFTFKNFDITLAEDYSYTHSNIVHNSISTSTRYQSHLEGFEELTRIEGTIGNPLSVLINDYTEKEISDGT